MSLSEEHTKWAREAGEAFAEGFAAEGKAKSMLATAGKALRAKFKGVLDMKEQGLYEPFRLAFKEAYLAKGSKEDQFNSFWARILYQYAWPGTGSAAGKWYKLDADGNPVPDKEKNLGSPSSPASPPPKFLKGIPHITPAEVVELGGFPLRLIVAAGSGGGKTTYIRELLQAVLPKLDIVIVVTGTLKRHWEGISDKLEVLEYSEDPDLGRVSELVEKQKELFRKKIPAGRPLVLLDDLGAIKKTKTGDVGELIDSFFLTLRNFDISIIALSQQQNNFLTPARRDGATCILVGDLSNAQREQIYGTLCIPPSTLPKDEFVTWCHSTLGRAHGHTFLAYLKEQMGRQLFLTRSDGPMEELATSLGGSSISGASPSSGGGGGSAYSPSGGGGGASAYSPSGGGGSRSGGGASMYASRLDEEEDDPEAASSGGGPSPPRDARRLQGGSRQEGARDLYTTYPATINPLLPVLEERLDKEKSLIWECCDGLGNISSVLKEAGFKVVTTDVYEEDGTMNPKQSFIDCKLDGESLSACPVPKGVTHIVTNPPFSEKEAFVERFYSLGIPTFCLLPVDTLGIVKCAKQFEEHGVEMFFLRGSAASRFYKVADDRKVTASTCAWFAFNQKAERKNTLHFL